MVALPRELSGALQVKVTVNGSEQDLELAALW
jgi:hypothetical protein